jgi:hypothetical protein
VSHGYNRTGRYMTEMGETLASRGMVAIVPDMPCTVLGGCDHTANADQVSGFIAWAIDQSANVASSPIYGKVDPLRRGAIGHSWGGLAVMLAAARDAELDSVLMLDPNDDQGAGAMAAPMATMPTAVIAAENTGACNATNWQSTVYPNTPAPHLRVRVKGSGHCDPEEPSDSFCPILCGSGDRATTPLFRRYAVAWTACILQADTAMAPYIGGTGLEADVNAGALDNVDQAGLETLPCTMGAVPPLPDSGVAIDSGMAGDSGAPGDDDAGAVTDGGVSEPSDGGVVADAGPAPGTDATSDVPAAPDAASTTPDASGGGSNNGATTDDGCVCVARKLPENGALSLFVAIGALLLVRRRRRG